MEKIDHKHSLPASIQNTQRSVLTGKFTKNIFILLFVFSILLQQLYSQSCYNPEVEDIISKVSIESLSSINRELTGEIPAIIGGESYTIISRYWKSISNQKASQYIYERLKSYGYEAEYWVYYSTGTNVIGTKTGSRFPNQKIIFCAHYDNAVFGTVPDTTHGADDNASGVSAVLEAARILMLYDLPYTTEFCAWDEEEFGLFGSDAYADSCYRHGDSIIAVINLDMIGWDGNNDRKMRVCSDSVFSHFSDLLVSVINVYGPELEPYSYLSGGGSDQWSFLKRGYRSALLIEDKNPDFNPYYHTIDDNFSNINKPYFESITRSALAALLVLQHDLIIDFKHEGLSNTNDTNSRVAEFLIKSGKQIASGYNSPRLYYKTGGGEYNALYAYYNNQDTFRFLIPGQHNGSFVSYYVAAQDLQGTMTGSLPAGARGLNPPGLIPPAKVFSYYVYDRKNQCSNSPIKEILPRTFLLDTIMVQVNGIILDINVNLSINHTNDSDLNIWLNRDGFSLNLLSKGNGGSGDNYSNTTFDDEAEIPIKEGTAPFTGEFKPEQPLSIFDNSEMQGSWKLRILNLSSDITGELVNWCVNFQYFDPIAVHINQLPVSMSLKQNYPNPFNASTNISYSLIKQSDVKISIFDVLGREVKTLVNKNLPAGEYVLSFNANDMASGLYFYSMFLDGNLFETKKMVLVK